MCLRINDVPSVPSLGRARVRMGAQIFYIDFKFTGNSGNSGNKAIESVVYGVPSIDAEWEHWEHPRSLLPLSQFTAQSTEQARSAGAYPFAIRESRM